MIKFALTPSTDEDKTSPIRILLAEDDPANALVGIELLTMFGYETDVVVNGADAVEKAKTGRYSIILMDIRMTEMDGFEATRRIRAFEREEGRAPTTIICITANAWERDKCIACGMDDFLAKPYRVEELESTLSKYARQRVK